MEWLFIYPAQGIASVNELVLPVDVPVRFSVASTSQINTAPTLAGVVYAMPSMKLMLNAMLNASGDIGAIRATTPVRAIPICVSGCAA